MKRFIVTLLIGLFLGFSSTGYATADNLSPTYEFVIADDVGAEVSSFVATSTEVYEPPATFIVGEAPLLSLVPETSDEFRYKQASTLIHKNNLIPSITDEQIYRSPRDSLNKFC